MRLALLSDIHANLEAFEACLAHARGQRIDGYVLLGDLVGYGADPIAVLDRVMALVDAGAVVLLGNHDAAIGQPPVGFHESARESADWTRAQLGPEYKAFLAGLPLTYRFGRALFVHASAYEPASWHYVSHAAAATRCMAATDASHVFVGHVHHQHLYFEGADQRLHLFEPSPATPIPVSRTRRWLATVGSVGQPRDRNQAAAYAVFDMADAELTFHRVAYDWRSAADKIRRAGLPAWLADRLGQGV